ncbi:MAG: EF-hand domain-containing protein [Gemmatimonadota bacterium]
MLSDLQTKKLTRYFQVYDIDDDGRIEQSDFESIIENVRMLRGSGAHSDTLRLAYMSRWNRLRAAADMDGDQSVDLDEWLAHWQLILEDDERFEKEAQAITDRLFRVFDLDEDDAIGPAEFADFYGVFGLSVDLARTVFQELDTNEDGIITRAELLQHSKDFYRGDDSEAAGNLLFGPIGV